MHTSLTYVNVVGSMADAQGAADDRHVRAGVLRTCCCRADE